MGIMMLTNSSDGGTTELYDIMYRKLGYIIYQNGTWWLTSAGYERMAFEAL